MDGSFALARRGEPVYVNGPACYVNRHAVEKGRATNEAGISLVQKDIQNYIHNPYKQFRLEAIGQNNLECAVELTSYSLGIICTALSFSVRNSAPERGWGPIVTDLPEKGTGESKDKF